MSELQSSVAGGQSGACQHQQPHTALQRGLNILVNRDWTQETGAQQSSPNILPGNTTFNNIISLHKTVSSSKLVIHTVYTSKAPKRMRYTLMHIGPVHRYTTLLIYSEHKFAYHQCTTWMQRPKKSLAHTQFLWCILTTTLVGWAHLLRCLGAKFSDLSFNVYSSAEIFSWSWAWLSYRQSSLQRI